MAKTGIIRFKVLSVADFITLEPVINFEKRHVAPECSKPAQNALLARCGTEWIYGFPHESQSLGESRADSIGVTGTKLITGSRMYE